MPTQPVQENATSKSTFFEDLKQYVGFTDDSTAALRELRPLAEPYFPAIVEDFYRAIREHPAARVVITGGEAQVARLKGTLTGWLETLLAGPHDETYFEIRARIGRVHVRIDLPQVHMFTAMSRLRTRLNEVLDRHVARLAPERHRRIAMAVEQILDLELAIMLQAYRDDLLAKTGSTERLATTGQFAAGIGHELRNPLAVIDSSVYLVRHALGTSSGAPGVEKYLTRIATEVKRATSTINDLLALANRRPPSRARTPVGPVVEAAIEASILPAAVVVETSIPDISGDFDQHQIRHVLSNLLTNASQALRGRGRVRVTAQVQARTLEIRVQDEGPGVPADVRDRIFEPLFTTRAQGSGIGLALCRLILEAHGGTVDLESTDTGACFVIRLPAGASPV
jgi:signal transduction histidine kinase